MVNNSELARNVAAALPYLRRYARALTGDQSTGDEIAAASLETIIHDKSLIEAASSAKIALFKAFHVLWTRNDLPVRSAETGLRGMAQKRMSALDKNSRGALLLHTIEEFDLNNVSEILGVTVDETTALIAEARSDIKNAVTGDVMLIEDETLIALEIQDLVNDMGHRLTGVARTRQEALDIASRTPPDLILADIQLADNSSGIDAVQDILNDLGERPVIFITAYPELFLTGERPEPAFLIAKPYSEAQVQSAVSQAMFFSSTESLIR